MTIDRPAKFHNVTKHQTCKKCLTMFVSEVSCKSVSMSTQRLLVSLPISKHDWLRIFPQKEEKNKAIYPLDYCTLHLKHCKTSLACVPNILLVRGRGRVRVESCRYVALIKRLLITPDTTRRHVAWDHSHEVCLRLPSFSCALDRKEISAV